MIRLPLMRARASPPAASVLVSGAARLSILAAAELDDAGQSGFFIRARKRLCCFLCSATLAMQFRGQLLFRPLAARECRRHAMRKRYYYRRAFSAIGAIALGREMMTPASAPAISCEAITTG